jgi:hypothetical protein
VEIRNLHPSTNTNEIGIAIEKIGFTIRQVSNVLHKITKQNLPIFFIDLESAEINHEIFQLKSLLHTKIKIEELFKHRNIIQCMNCQEYGHSKIFCAHPARCVRCAGNHLTNQCTKSTDLPPTYALCGKAHPANYRGCTVYKDLQKMNLNNSKNNIYSKNIVKTTSYVNQGEAPSQETSMTASNLKNNKIFLNPPQNHTAETYSKKTSPSQHQSYQNTFPDNNILNHLSSFLTEFKQIINLPIVLLTTVK